jgi:hypothetical protein
MFVTVECHKCNKRRDVSQEEAQRERAKDDLWMPWCDDCHFPMMAVSARSR